MEGWNWAATFLGGGTLASLVALISALANRRSVRSEAKARDLKSPAELDQIMATTRAIEVETLLKVNSVVVKENDGLRSRLTALEERADQQDDLTEGMQKTLSVLEDALAQAHDFITVLLGMIEMHLPNVKLPPLPRGYKRPKKERI